MLSVTTVSTSHDLRQILSLQSSNLKENISKEEKDSQGFVTMHFTMEMLKAMHDLSPSVIVKEDDKVIAYAIVFLKEGRFLYPTLEPMFVNFESLSINNKPLNDHKFYVMGQICIDKKYRGSNVFDLLYIKHKELHQDHFDFVITEISTSNVRSLRAHLRTGFRIISTHRDDLDEWQVVIWDWK